LSELLVTDVGFMLVSERNHLHNGLALVIVPGAFARGAYLAFYYHVILLQVDLQG
jgi:hypothetical protein